MRKSTFMHASVLLFVSLSFVGCQRSTYDVWEDTKTCGRNVGRGFRSLGGKHGDSRAVYDRQEFYTEEAVPYDEAPYLVHESYEPDFIPLTDSPRENGVDLAYSPPPPKDTPGDPGSPIPGIEAFKDPSTIPGLAGTFKNIQFEYNSSLVKGQDNLDQVHAVAQYMKQHPQTYLFVEGHCDERGPEAYNMALGSRRSHSVRDMLIEQGVDPNQIFTISYGKERPLILDNHEEGWSKNRRAEFKIYQR